jgi:hypothetical protein
MVQCSATGAPADAVTPMMCQQIGSIFLGHLLVAMFGPIHAPRDAAKVSVPVMDRRPRLRHALMEFIVQALGHFLSRCPCEAVTDGQKFAPWALVGHGPPCVCLNDYVLH